MPTEEKEESREAWVSGRLCARCNLGQDWYDLRFTAVLFVVFCVLPRYVLT